MSKVSKECLDGALAGLRNFGKEDLEAYVQDVFSRARSYDNLNSNRAFDRAIKEINDENLRALFEDASIKANNIDKYDRNAKKLNDKTADMRSLLTKRYANLGDNVASAQKAAQGRLDIFFFRDLNFEEIEFFNNGKNDELISDAYDGRDIKDPIAKKIADKLHKYFDYRNSELIISNAMRFNEINEDRMFRQIHDSGRMMSGGKSIAESAKDFFGVGKKYETTDAGKLWREEIKKHLNLKETFKYTKATDLEGNLDLNEVDKIFDRTFDNITTNKSEIFTKSTVINDREAVKKRSRMFFKFNDMRAFLEYNKVYGKNNLFGALRSDMQASASKIGTAELWGDSPYNMYTDLRNVQQGVNSKTGFWWSNTDNYFKATLGLDKSSKDANVSNISSNIRTLSTMARLPKITLQSVSDIGYVAAFGQRLGMSYFKVYTDLIKNIFNKYPSENRKYIAKLFSTMVNGQLGFTGRWVDANNGSELLNKVSTRFFKFVGLHAFDSGNKVGIMTLMSEHLFNSSGKPFGELNTSLQKWIGKFMNKDEWDLLRNKNKDGLFTTDNVDALTDDELRTFKEKNNLNTPVYQLRNDLYRKVYSMFDVASENAVLSPGEFERAWCFQGESSGTAKGEFLRIVSHFKMYTMSYIDRVLVNGFKDADTPQQKIMWATSMLMGTLPLSIMSTYLVNLADGKSMPDWDLMNVPDREKFLVELLAPSLAIFSGLLDSNSQNSSMVFSLLASPSTRLISNAMAAGAALIEGDPAKSAKKLGKAAEYIFPIQTIPVISPFIREALGDEAHLDPGQTHIFGQ